MKQIEIRGEICETESWSFSEGKNNTPGALSKSLRNAGDEDVLITIHSPGGSVYAGLEMFSQIVNYPHHTETKITALAASMASILALAGDKISAENTAVFMMHNPISFVYGSYVEMDDMSMYLKKVGNHLAAIYEKNTKLEHDTILNMMGSETWLFGNELADLGFEMTPDNLISDVENTVNRMKYLTEAASEVQVITDRYKNKSLPVQLDDVPEETFEKIAAHVGLNKVKDRLQVMPFMDTKLGSIGRVKISADADTNINYKEVEMEKLTAERLKAENPEVYNEIFIAGAFKERNRVCAHITMGTRTGAVDFAHSCIEDGNSISDETVQAEYFSARLNKQDIDNRTEDDPGNTPVSVNIDEKQEVSNLVKEAMKLSTKKGGADVG